jgi:hypothetical protein
MLHHDLRRPAAFLLAVALAGAGCASDEPKSEKTSQPTVSQKPAADPAPKPKPADPAPAQPAQDQSAAPIVIKGSKRKDTADASTTSAGDDPERAARIEALKQRAAASQGQDNGQALKGEVPQENNNKPKARTKDAIRSEIAAIDAKVASLETDRKDLVSKEATRRGPKEVASDPEKVAAIDQQIAELKQKKADDLAEIAAIDAAGGEKKDDKKDQK